MLLFSIKAAHVSANIQVCSVWLQNVKCEQRLDWANGD